MSTERPRTSRSAPDRDAAPSRVSEGRARALSVALSQGPAEQQLVEALEECERRLDEAEQLAQLGSFTWDPTSDEMQWSDGLYRILGERPREVVPSYAGFLGRLEAGDRAVVDEVVRRALCDATAFTCACAMAVRDGGARWLEVRGEVVGGARGRAARLRGTVREITERKRAERALAGHDLRDALTGAGSRALLDDRARRAIERSRRSKYATALLVVDIDRFRDINATLGHDVGDEVLVAVARRLEALVRPYDTVARCLDTVARLGGDEFLVLCEHLDGTAGAVAVARRISEAFEDPLVVGGRQVAVTVSTGIAVAPARRGRVASLIVDGEVAMRQAKGRGRGQCEVFAPEMYREPPERELARDLATALEEGQFRLLYQPKVSLVTGRITGVEALLRWQHPTRGTVPPLELIALAEETGCIVAIGAWVLDEACRQAASWQHSLPSRPDLVVSVNVSARQFGSGLAKVVTDALSKSALEPSRLCLEVTETMVMEDVASAIETLRLLAGLGILLSIDDFGTGYSSLAYLKRFPLHELKIDKCFVDGLGKNADDTAIVAAIMGMAQALDLSVVAEGVESAEQLAQLLTLGCDEAQGYYFARPVAPEAVRKLLVREAEASWTGTALAHSALDPGDSPALRSDSVLVVDDSADVRQLARMSLAAAGFAVHEAVDGRAALAAARRLRPDCVVLDVSMPGIDGFAVCEALRSDPATACCTIVMLSAKAEAANKVAAFSRGADDYVIKPFSPRDLVSRVRSAVNRRRGT